MTLDQFVPAVVDAADARSLPRPRIVLHLPSLTGGDAGVSFYWQIDSWRCELHHRYAITSAAGEVDAPPPDEVVATVEHELAAFAGITEAKS